MELPSNIKIVPGIGASCPRLMVVGEAPGAVEEQAGKPFVGPAGDMLSVLLRTAGMNRDECYLTNVVKVRPPDNKIPRLKELGVEVEDFYDTLYEEIKIMQPNAILALGNTALKALTGETGISNWRGSILPLKGHVLPKVIPTIHPASLINPHGAEVIAGYAARHYVQLDIERAVLESQTKELRLPSRTLVIAKNSGQVNSFFTQYRLKKEVAADIEVRQSFPFCISFAFVPHHAISIPLFPLKGINENKQDLAHCWQMVARILAEKEIIGQNWKFDSDRLEAIGFPPGNLTFDTMLASHTLYPELSQSLQFSTSIYTREPFYKHELKEFDPRKHKIDRVLTYNARDSAVTIEIKERQKAELKEEGLLPFFEDFVMPLHNLYRKIDRQGMRQDLNRQAEIIEDLSQRFNAKYQELKDLIGHAINPNSPPQVAALLYSELKLPKRASTNNQTLTALLGNSVKTTQQADAIELVLLLRKIKKAIGTYATAPPDFDCRMRTSYRITGTETGRTSTSVLKPPLRPYKMGMAIQTLTHRGIGSEVRNCYVADEGTIFIKADQAQAEARVVALLADDKNLLKMMDEIDIHKKTAEVALGIPMAQVNEGQRFIGKMGRHSFGYGVKKRTLMLQINSIARDMGLDLTVSEWKCGKILEALEQMHPLIEQNFRAEIRRLLDETDILETGNGRRRQFFGEPGESRYKEGYAYIPQSRVGDHTKSTMSEHDKKYKERVPIVIEEHDGFMVQSPLDMYWEVVLSIKEMFERPLDFSRCSISRGSISIPCEIEAGFRMGEMVKVRV